MSIYKAVICDLDGTLLNSDHTISNYTSSVITKLINNGIKFFIATGRHHKDAVAFKKMLGLKDSFLITSNGAKIHDNNNREIFSHNIPKEIAREIIKFHVDDEILRGIYKDDFWFIEKPIDGLDEFHKESGFKSIVKPFEELIGEDITKFFFISENQEKISSLEKNLSFKFENDLNITLSFDNCIEIVQKGVSKGSAIKKILHKENIASNEVIAFGDSLNDLDMLESAGKGILMGNSLKKLQELLCNYEITETNNNDGVAKYLEKIFLINN